MDDGLVPEGDHGGYIVLPAQISGVVDLVFHWALLSFRRVRVCSLRLSCRLSKSWDRTPVGSHRLAGCGR